MEAAARAARLHETLARLPDGYATKVGERGLKLSGGEKQRVAIARVFMKNAPILLCDEATSALDAGTEASVMQSLLDVAGRAEKGERRTMLIIAHRLASVQGADAIAVMDGGRVVQLGTHDALLREGGLYAALWARQGRGEEGRSEGAT